MEKSLSRPNSVSTADASPLPRRPAAMHGFPRLEQHQVALVLLQHGEIERHAGLAREAMQHAFAEGVDGLDTQAARRFQRMGEQRAARAAASPASAVHRSSRSSSATQVVFTRQRPACPAARRRARASPPPPPWCR